jgi:hypothetical protein
MKNSKWIAFLCLAGFMVVFGCVATEPQKIPENVKLGEFKQQIPGTQMVIKTTKKMNTTNKKYLLAEETIKGEAVIVQKEKDAKTGQVYDPASNNWKGEWDFENDRYLQQASPSTNALQFPLFVGKKYSAGFDYSEEGGWSGHVGRTARVEGIESLNVGDQAYEVFKIRIVSDGGNIITLWYSPELAYNVKSIFESSQKGTSQSELVSIKLP